MASLFDPLLLQGLAGLSSPRIPPGPPRGADESKQTQPGQEPHAFVVCCAGWNCLAGALGRLPIGLSIGYAYNEAVVGENGVDVWWIFPPFVLT
jgi:hypothetical protein